MYIKKCTCTSPSFHNLESLHTRPYGSVDRGDWFLGRCTKWPPIEESFSIIINKAQEGLESPMMSSLNIITNDRHKPTTDIKL